MLAGLFGSELLELGESSTLLRIEYQSLLLVE